MANPPIALQSDQLLGRVAVAAKLITMEQLARATREQGRAGSTRSLGEILIELGYLTEATLRQALDLQKAVIERAKKKGDAAGAHEVGVATDEHAARVHAPAAATSQPEAKGATAIPVPEKPAARSAGPLRLENELDMLLIEAAGKGASDIHIHSGAGMRLRVRGALVEMSDKQVTQADAERLILPILSADQRSQLASDGELDLSYSVKGLARFRVNVYRQLRGLDATLRRISLQPPTLAELNLPSTFAKFTNFHQGMVLITGPSACGKSSTMAALVNLVNEERAEHILTVEDPIEYLHTSKRCIVNQRHVKHHTESFARALRAALREDPDVIVIGELRDRETISLAMTAAETGHFVLATLHTDNAIRTVNRIIGSFPPDQQDQVRTMLSESLRAVISQRLLPRANGNGMVPAIEVLVTNRAVGNLIRKNETVQIRSVMQTSSSQGMNLLDASLAQLVKSREVKREDALKHAEDPKQIPDK